MSHNGNNLSPADLKQINKNQIARLQHKCLGTNIAVGSLQEKNSF